MCVHTFQCLRHTDNKMLLQDDDYRNKENKNWFILVSCVNFMRTWRPTLPGSKLNRAKCRHTWLCFCSNLPMLNYFQIWTDFLELQIERRKKKINHIGPWVVAWTIQTWFMLSQYTWSNCGPACNLKYFTLILMHLPLSSVKKHVSQHVFDINTNVS